MLERRILLILLEHFFSKTLSSQEIVLTTDYAGFLLVLLSHLPEFPISIFIDLSCISLSRIYLPELTPF